MKQIAFLARAITAVRPVDFIRRRVRAGLLVAIVVAGVVAMLETATISRECGGAFSRAFSAAFDRFHCELVIRLARGGYKFKIPLPGLQ